MSTDDDTPRRPYVAYISRDDGSHNGGDHRAEPKDFEEDVMGAIGKLTAEVSQMRNWQDDLGESLRVVRHAQISMAEQIDNLTLLIAAVRPEPLPPMRKKLDSYGEFDIEEVTGGGTEYFRMTREQLAAIVDNKIQTKLASQFPQAIQQHETNVKAASFERLQGRVVALIFAAITAAIAGYLTGHLFHQ